MDIVLLLHTRSVRHPYRCLCALEKDRRFALNVQHIYAILGSNNQRPPSDRRSRLIVQGRIDFEAGMTQRLGTIIWDTGPFHFSALLQFFLREGRVALTDMGWPPAPVRATCVLVHIEKGKERRQGKSAGGHKPTSFQQTPQISLT